MDQFKSKESRIYSLSQSQNKMSSDLDSLKELSIETYKHCIQIKGKDTVLVVGVTGVGKSLFTNKWSGKKIVCIREEYKDVLDVDGEPVTQVGHDVAESKTLLPTFVEGDGYYVADCPGFLDNRGVEEKLITTLSIRLTVLNANVKGIVVMLDVKDLIDRSANFLQTGQILGKLLKHDTDAIHYVFNNKFNLNVSQEQLLGLIAKHLSTAKSRLVALKNQIFGKMKLISQESSENDAACCAFLEKLVNSTDRIHMMDFFNDDIIQEIRVAMSDLKGIDKSAFGLDDYDPIWQKLKTSIEQQAEEAVLDFSDYLSTIILIDKINDTLRDKKSRIEFYQQRLVELQGLNIGEKSTQIDKKFQNMIEENKQKIRQTQSKLNLLLPEIENTNELISSSKDAIKRYSSSEEEIMVFKKDINDERMPFFGRIFYTKVKIEHNSNCVVKENARLESGQLVPNSNHGNNFLYSKHYTTDWGEDGKMSLELKAKLKDLPSSKWQCQLETTKLEQAVTKLATLTQQKKDLELFITGLNLEITGYEVGLLGMEEQKKAVENELSTLTSAIEGYKKHIEMKEEELKQVVTIFEDKKKKIQSKDEVYEDLKDLLFIIGLETSSVGKEFIQYHSKIKNNDTNPKNDSKQDSDLDNLVCPISFELMLDPVILPCCSHSVDRNSIYRMFYRTHKEQCPLCRCPLNLSTVKKNRKLAELVESYYQKNQEMMPQEYLTNKPVEHVEKLEKEMAKNVEELESKLQSEMKKLEKARQALSVMKNKNQ